MKKIERRRGFSIAEALMALLVVSLITVATVPVVTKKKRDASQGVHGEWVCYMSGSSHVTQITQDGKTTTSSGSDCTFVPPGKAKNFSVKVVGGGGGGAAGSMPVPKTYYSSTSFKPDKNGDYVVAVIGGGGGGGQIRCGSQARTGGTGGWDIQDVTLRTDRTCTVTIGKAGEGNCGHNSKAWDRITGGTTEFNCNGYIVRATGGEVGDSRDTDASDCDWKGWSAGRGGTPNGQSYIQTGNLYQQNIINNTRLQRYISSTSYGRGGSVGNESGKACGNGTKGAMAVMRINTTGGGAGSPGASVIKTYPKLNVVKVRLGQGGAGGSSNGGAGGNGGNTTFGSMITAMGGNAGEPEFSVSNGSQSKGQNASTPSYTLTTSIQRSYGGYTASNSGINATAAGGSSFNGVNGAGSGGAGGGSAVDEYGKGAPGRPGIVVVNW